LASLLFVFSLSAWFQVDKPVMGLLFNFVTLGLLYAAYQSHINKHKLRVNLSIYSGQIDKKRKSLELP
jgi:hypothetical protein